MKKTKHLFAAFLSFVTLFSLTSCSDSDNEPENYADKVAKSYSGYTVTTSAYFQNMVTPSQTVTITASGVNTVNISYTSTTLGSFTITDANVSMASGEYLISGKGKSVMGMADASSNEYDCNFSGKVADGTASFSFTCPTVMGGTTISFEQGEIPAEVVLPGTYTGFTEAKCAYFDGMIADDQTVTITENNGKFTVAFESDTWGKFLIEDITATLSNDKFELSGEGTAEMGMNGNVSTYACTFTGSISVDKENSEFSFVLPTVMNGLTIEFHNGDAPADAE